MKFSFVILIVLLVSTQLTANTHPSLENDDKTLKQRYQLLKEKTETFNEYKVIKENLLDDFWKMTLDSLGGVRADLNNAAKDIQLHQSEINSLKSSITQREEVVAGILHDGSHIRFMGIDFDKAFFITFFSAIVLVLLALCGLLFFRFKAIFSSSKENRQLFDQLQAEFEAYKHNALEKQMRLSRELQTERNRLQERLSAR